MVKKIPFGKKRSVNYYDPLYYERGQGEKKSPSQNFQKLIH